MLQVVFLRKVFGIKNLFSPIYVLLYIYLITGIAGYLVYTTFPDFASFGYTSIVIQISREENALTLRYFLVFLNEIYLGALTLLFFSEIVRIVRRDARKKQYEDKFYFAINAQSKNNQHLNPEVTRALSRHIRSPKPLSVKLNPNLLVVLYVIPPLLLIIGVSPEKMLHRDNYLESSFRFLVSLGNVLILPASIGLGYNLASKTSLLNRFFCTALILVDFLTLFALGTRALAIFPMLLTCGYWLNSNRKKVLGVLLSIVTIALFSPLIFLPLYLRGAPNHGLLPYLHYASNLNLAVLFQPPIGFISNFLFSFPLTGELIKLRAIRAFSIDYLLISVNPLPGDFVGWYLINRKFALNDATPFNTIGEIYLYGDVISFWLFFSLGAMITFISVVFQRNLKKNRIIYALLLLMLVFLFAITSLQYNLRSSTRILYLAFVLACLVYKRSESSQL